jgi:mevalonate kinase
LKIELQHHSSSSAPGKVILFGEHAVVYGRPAVAVPVTQARATATIQANSVGAGLTLVAHDLGRSVRLADAPQDDPLAVAARLTLDHLGLAQPDASLTVRSSIPIASGMGSGAAVSTAVVRALAAYLGHDLDLATVSDLVYEVEKIHHGTPSGIDNTVVVYERPVYFVRGQPVQTFAVGAPLHLVVADTGISSPTRAVVGDVRRAWQQNETQYEMLFDWIAGIVGRARAYLEEGLVGELGPLLDENHALLREMGVSSPELERLVAAAREAGALGTKLSGAGRGGNMIALINDDAAGAVVKALRQAGAVRVIETVIV